MLNDLVAIWSAMSRAGARQPQIAAVARRKPGHYPPDHAVIAADKPLDQAARPWWIPQSITIFRYGSAH
jgi:hypothetical protein